MHLTQLLRFDGYGQGLIPYLTVHFLYPYGLVLCCNVPTVVLVYCMYSTGIILP